MFFESVSALRIDVSNRFSLVVIYMVARFIIACFSSDLTLDWIIGLDGNVAQSIIFEIAVLGIWLDGSLLGTWYQNLIPTEEGKAFTG